jgi:small-conductance mechanosensitive channel
MPNIDEAKGDPQDAVRKLVRDARVRYLKPPLQALFLITVVPAIVFFFYGFKNYLTVMPDILFISAIFVIFIGAWWDFGEKSYVKELEDYYKKRPTPEDMTYINKQQLIMTFLYILVAMLYVMVAVIIYFI